MKNVCTRVMIFLSLISGFQLNGFGGLRQVSKPGSVAVSNQVSILVAALGLQSQRQQFSSCSPYSYEAFISHGFSEKNARLRSLIAAESKETQRQIFEGICPFGEEIVDNSLVQVVDVVRKHKNIDIPVTLFRCDLSKNNPNAFAAMQLGLTKFPAIMLFSTFYKANSSSQMYGFYHELQHFMQTLRHPDAYLGCDRIREELDADDKAFKAITCCACIEDIILFGRNDDRSELKGYFGRTRLQAIIDERENVDKPGTCDGHKKIFSGKGSTVQLKDFLPNEAKR